MASDFELRTIDRVVTSRLASQGVINAINEAVRSSLNESAQKVQVNIASIAEQVVELFKKDFKVNIGNFVDSWVTNNGGLVVVPNGTRLLKVFGGTQLCVVEHSPMVRTVRFENDRTEGGGAGQYVLAFPYCIYLAWVTRDNTNYRTANLSVLYAKKPLDSLDSIVYTPNLPNISEGGKVCMGHDFSDRVGYRKNLKESVEDAISYFWQSTFNNDIPHSFTAGRQIDQRIRSLRAWQDASKVDPMFMLKINWQNGRHLKALFSDTVASDIRLQVGPIIDRAVNEAGTRLMNYFNAMRSGPEASQKAVGVFRTRLYDQLLGICNEVLSSVKPQYEEMSRQRVREEVEREIARRGATIEKPVRKMARYEAGDYLYHPPTAEVW